MSNYLSQPIKYAAPPTDANFELLSKVALMQQQKYDVNHQQVQQTLDAFGAMKTLRPEDDAYIAGKLNSIVTQANSMGGNLANQSITDQFLYKIKSAAQDPFILNAMEQTKKKATVDAQVAELKKKDPSLVNDKNYRDMLDLGGYTDYMAGKTDKMGSLSYNPYVDITTTLHKKAADYTKERGLKDEYLGTENGTFETVDKFGNKVTEREIQDYLYSNLSGAEKTQMQIDARSNYKYMPQADFDKIILDDTKAQNSLLNEGLAKLKAEQASKSESERGAYTTMISETDARIKDNEQKISKGTFSKDEMYNYHAKNVVNSIAANYDINRVTKLDRNDLPFEIMKFEKETQLKEADLALKKAKLEQDNAAASGQGTATTIPTPTEDLKSTGLEVVQKNVHQADAALDAYLKQTSEDYRKMSPRDQWTYKLNLKLPKSTIAGANPTLKALVDDFSSAQSNYATIINDAKPRLSEITRENYNNLIGGKDLNLNNLASTMPLSAGLLKGKRTFDSLSKEEQLGVVTEFAASNLQHNGSLKGDTRKIYEKIVDSNRAELSKINSPKAKQILQSIAHSSSKEEIGSVLGEGLQAIGSAFGNAAAILGRGIGSMVTDPYVLATQGEDAMRAQMKSREKDAVSYNQYVANASRRADVAARSLFGGEDTDVTELESKDTRNGRDVKASFDAFNNDLKNRIEKSTSSFMANQKETKAFSFSTDDKAQKGTAIALRQAVLANGGAIDDGTKDFTISKSGAQYQVSYMDKKGENRITTTIPKLPDSVVGMFNTSTQNWNNNPNNPNIKLEPITVTPYTSPAIRDKEVKAATENNSFTREQRVMLLTNPGATAFATIPEVRDRVRQVYSDAFYDKNKTQIEDILKTPYRAVPTVEGGAFYMKLEYMDNGELKTYYSPNPLGAVKDDYQFHLQYIEASAKVRDARIKALTQR